MFKEKIEEGFFLEWSDAYGTYYGSPQSVLSVLETGISLLVILDQPGALRVHSLYSKTVLIWLESPQIEVLERRLHARGSESEDGRLFRLGLAKQENKSELLKQYQYRLTNDSLHNIVDSFYNIIQNVIARQRN